MIMIQPIFLIILCLVLLGVFIKYIAYPLAIKNKKQTKKDRDFPSYKIILVEVEVLRKKGIHLTLKTSSEGYSFSIITGTPYYRRLKVIDPIYYSTPKEALSEGLNYIRKTKLN